VPEIVACAGYPIVYRADGSVMWRQTGVGCSWEAPAIGDVDGDGHPEVLMGLSLMNGATGAVLRTVGGFGGYYLEMSLMADFDGDGVPDIGVAGSDHYVVFSGARIINPAIADGALQLWSRPTHDFSSAVTGSSVFDFNGDGRAEVIYGDELHLWMFDGPT